MLHFHQRIFNQIDLFYNNVVFTPTTMTPAVSPPPDPNEINLILLHLVKNDCKSAVLYSLAARPQTNWACILPHPRAVNLNIAASQLPKVIEPPPLSILLSCWMCSRHQQGRGVDGTLDTAPRLTLMRRWRGPCPSEARAQLACGSLAPFGRCVFPPLLLTA